MENYLSICCSKIERLSKKIELLNDIYKNPKYYSGYYIKNIVGNLSLLGSVPAEQNHSSIVAFLGKGAMWDIWEHLKNLCERHQVHCDYESREEAKLTVSSHKFQSSFDDEIAHEDVKAKQALAGYPYKLFYESIKKSMRLQMKLDSDKVTHLIWPANEIFDRDKHISLVVGQRCTCRRRIDFNIQCEHELKAEPQFKVELWGDRWLTRKEFNMRHPDLMYFPTTNVSELMMSQNMSMNQVENNNTGTSVVPRRELITNGTDTDNTTLNVMESEEAAPDVIDLSQDKNFILQNKDEIVGYKDLMHICSELCRTVCNNKDASRSVYCSIHEWINELRSGKPFEVMFKRNMLYLTQDSLCTNTDEPKPATITPAKGARNQVRFKSSQELMRGNFARNDKEVAVYDVDYEPKL